MKKFRLFSLAGLMFLFSFTYSHDIPESEVPSLVINSFKQKFSVATNVEWEVMNDNYCAEFHTGIFTEHDVWFDSIGNMLKHKQEISSKDLPGSVLKSAKKSFKGYWIKDADKTISGNDITYTLELQSLTRELEVVFGSDGRILTKSYN